MSISKTVDTVVMNIKRMREIKGWNKSDLAIKCEVDPSYISRIENADRYIGLESIEKIAEAFGVEVYELFLPKTSKEYENQHLSDLIDSFHPLKKEMIMTMINACKVEQEMEKQGK